MSTQAAWSIPTFVLSSALSNFIGESCSPDVLSLLAIAVVLISTSGFFVVCRASPPYSCFVYSSSNSSMAAMGIATIGDG
jgi:hypothetical protein